MSWKEFVLATKGDDMQKDVARKTGVNASTISRWLSSGDAGKADNVIAFARAYDVPPLAALVAAELLSEKEARMRPAAAPDYSNLTNDELLELVRARMREDVMGNAEHPAANSEPASGSANVSIMGMRTTRKGRPAAARKVGKAPAGQRKKQDESAEDMEPR